MTEEDPGVGIYFSLREIGIILFLSVLAAVSGALVSSYLFPEERVSDIVYNVLHLPGPGAGVLIFGSILCFWLLLGLVIVKKNGTAAAMAVVLVAIDLLFGTQAIVLQSLDVLIFVALIVEVVCLLPVVRNRGNTILAIFLAGCSIATLVIAWVGLAKEGETDTALTLFPWVYYVMGFLGLIMACILWRFPVRYLVAGSVANMYYMFHFWLFWGSGVGTRFPPDPAMVPVLLLIALLGGAIAGSMVCGMEFVLNRYFLKASAQLADAF